MRRLQEALGQQEGLRREVRVSSEAEWQSARRGVGWIKWTTLLAMPGFSGFFLVEKLRHPMDGPHAFNGMGLGTLALMLFATYFGTYLFSRSIFSSRQMCQTAHYWKFSKLWKVEAGWFLYIFGMMTWVRVGWMIAGLPFMIAGFAWTLLFPLGLPSRRKVED